MPFDVMLLVAGDPPPSPSITRGVIIDVITFTGVSEPWGFKTVAPNWIRETVTVVPGATRQESEDEARTLLKSLRSGFIYSAVPGAAPGFQRYRTEANPALSGNLNANSKAFVRDGILADTNGVMANEDENSFEIDVVENWVSSISEATIEFGVITSELGNRRVAYPSGIIFDALDGVPAGQPATMTHPWPSLEGLLSDKLRGPIP